MTKILIEEAAVKLVLDALETAWYHVGTFYPTEEAIELYDDARAALKALAEQPAQQVVDCHATGVCVQSGLRAEQLRAFGTLAQPEPFGFAVMENPIAPPAQRTWVGLTDEEIEKLITDAGFTRSDLLMMGACIDQIARLVEAKLRSKNEDRN